MRNNNFLSTLIENGMDIKTNVPIELVTINDIIDFMNVTEQLNCNIYIVGKDEQGGELVIPPTSLLSLTSATAKSNNRNQNIRNSDTFNNTDWNTIRVVADEDIFTAIKQFVKE